MEFIENVKIDLFPDEVYVFSPAGEIYELPQGSTPVDFAYAVHTDIGNTCVACRIDRRLACFVAGRLFALGNRPDAARDLFLGHAL